MNVFLSERDVLDQHGRLRAEEDSQQRLKHRVDQHEARGHGRGRRIRLDVKSQQFLDKIQVYCQTVLQLSRTEGDTGLNLKLLNHSHLQLTEQQL